MYDISSFLIQWMHCVRNDKRVQISTGEIADAVIMLDALPFSTIEQFLCISVPLLGKTPIAQVLLRKEFWRLFNSSVDVKELFDAQIIQSALASSEKKSLKESKKKKNDDETQKEGKSGKKSNKELKEKSDQSEKAKKWLAKNEKAPAALRALASDDKKAAAQALREEPIDPESWLKALEKLAKEAGKEMAMHWLDLLPIAAELDKHIKKSQLQAKKEQEQWLEKLKEIETKKPTQAIRPTGKNEFYIASHMSDVERAHVRMIVRRMAEQIRLTLSKERLGKRRGVINVPKTLRESLATYGEPMITFESSGVRRTRRFVTFTDLSGSMKLVAELLATVQFELHKVLQSDRHYGFVGDAADITDLLKGDCVKAASAVLHSAKLDYRAYSDYGSSFQDLLRIAPSGLFDDAVVFIMGDARNNQYSPGLEELRFIKKRAHQVIWLNPEIRNKWNSGDSIAAVYQNEVDAFFDISTLDSFTHVLKQLPNMLMKRC